MSEYIKYNGDYEKVYYDIKTYDGKEYSICYPIAGDFHTVAGKHIKGHDVELFKLSDKHPLDVLRSGKK